MTNGDKVHEWVNTAIKEYHRYLLDLADANGSGKVHVTFHVHEGTLKQIDTLPEKQKRFTDNRPLTAKQDSRPMRH